MSRAKTRANSWSRADRNSAVQRRREPHEQCRGCRCLRLTPEAVPPKHSAAGAHATRTGLQCLANCEFNPPPVNVEAMPCRGGFASDVQEFAGFGSALTGDFFEIRIRSVSRPIWTHNPLWKRLGSVCRSPATLARHSTVREGYEAVVCLPNGRACSSLACRRARTVDFGHVARGFCPPSLAHRVFVARWGVPHGSADGQGARA